MHWSLPPRQHRHPACDELVRQRNSPSGPTLFPARPPLPLPSSACQPRRATIPSSPSRSWLTALAAPIAYLIGATLLWRHFDFIYYKDILSYLSSGEKLARGRSWPASTPTGSPSSRRSWRPSSGWVSPERAVDAVKILNGLIALQGARALVGRGTTGWLAGVLDAVLVVVALYCAMPFMSADLLISGILCFYFSIVLRQDYRRAEGRACWRDCWADWPTTRRRTASSSLPRTS